MQIFAKTNRGLIRSSNQDTLLIAHNTYGVADGMGGHLGGETASRVAAQEVKSFLSGKTPDERLASEALRAANQSVYDMQKKDGSLKGMGTTMTLLWEGEDAVIVAHVGDSRAYLLRGGELTQKTEDHSVVAELVRNKLITPEMALTHPYKSVITRALGTDPQVVVDTEVSDKQVGDVWLVCSDGLYNMVTDDTIKEILTSLSPEKAADKLLELALENGGQDNVSFVLGKVTGVAKK